MKIFVTGVPGANGYLTEVIKKSSHDFIYGDLKDVSEDVEIILFQWPEELVGWKYPSDKDLNELEAQITVLKQRFTLVGIVHNLRPHHFLGVNQDKLYHLVYKHLDVFYHFGKYSLNLLKGKYKDSSHIVIHHPLYRTTLKKFPVQTARALLHLDLNERIIVVPGKVRNWKEQKLILKVAQILKSKNVKLVVLQMKNKKFDPLFKGYYFLKRFVNFDRWNERWYKKIKAHHNVLFLTDKLSDRELSLWVSASNAVWIARTNILNSGLFYLSLTFDKPVIGPKTGNLKEHLEQVGLPGYRNSSKSELKKEFNTLLSLLEDWDGCNTDVYEPENVARTLDLNLNSL